MIVMPSIGGRKDSMNKLSFVKDLVNGLREGGGGSGEA